MSDTTETWQVVPGFGGKYEASNLGRVRVAETGQIKSTHIGTRGYPSISLYYKGRHARRVHQLIAAAFHGLCPEGMEVRHLDGVKTNNIPSNLAYGTHAENLRDSVLHGATRNAHTDKTHCIRGHEFTPATTRIYAGGTKRGCIPCEKLRGEAKRLGITLSKPPTPRNPKRMAGASHGA